MLVKDPTTGKTHAPSPGELYTNPTFAKTLRSVVEHGQKGFYEGRIAQAIVDLIQSQGGVMTLEDLATHTSTHVKPISYSYGGANGVTLHECPPNGQGLVALIALGIVEALEDSGVVNLKEEKHNSSLYLHTLMWVFSSHICSCSTLTAHPLQRGCTSSVCRRSSVHHRS